MRYADHIIRKRGVKTWQSALIEISINIMKKRRVKISQSAQDEIVVDRLMYEPYGLPTLILYGFSQTARKAVHRSFHLFVGLCKVNRALTFFK